MLAKRVKGTAVSLIVASVLGFGILGATALPASAGSSCGGGNIGHLFSSIHPEEARTLYGKDRNVTKGTLWPGVSVGKVSLTVSVSPL